MSYRIIPSAALLALVGPGGLALASGPQLRLELYAGSGVTLDRGTSWLEKVIYSGCGAAPTVETVQAAVDLTTEWTIDDPDDGSCTVSLVFESDFVLEGVEGSNDFLVASPIRRLDIAITSGNTATVALPGSPRVLEGIYGGNPEIIITRD